MANENSNLTKTKQNRLMHISSCTVCDRRKKQFLNKIKKSAKMIILLMINSK